MQQFVFINSRISRSGELNALEDHLNAVPHIRADAEQHGTVEHAVKRRHATSGAGRSTEKIHKDPGLALILINEQSNDALLLESVPDLHDRIRAFAQQVDAEAPAGFVVKFVGERIRLRSGIDRHRIAPFG